WVRIVSQWLRLGLHRGVRAATLSPVVTPGKAANIYIRRCAVALSHRITRTAKINSPPANSRLAMNVPQPKSPQCFAVAGSNRFGKIGTRRCVERDDFICSGGL